MGVYTTYREAAYRAPKVRNRLTTAVSLICLSCSLHTREHHAHPTLFDSGTDCCSAAGVLLCFAWSSESSKSSSSLSSPRWQFPLCW